MSIKEENANYLIHQARAAGITDLRELAIFMGQMEVESGGFRSMHEGLSYRPERLLDVFGPYTDRRGVWHDGRNGLTNITEAQGIVSRGPQGIAEAIYGGPWGARNLGNTDPGDGWKYHGRGYVQLTGRDNYERIGGALGVNLANDPNLAADREIAARIAIHYWQDRVRANGNQLNIAEATRDINGGQNHLGERRAAAQAWERKFEQGYLDRLPAPVQPNRAPPPASNDSAHAPRGSARPGSASIYDEAHRHFLAGGNRFEYGRGDMQLRNNEGVANRTTDSSRTEQDNDRDGLRGVDCSSFVWRGLKNAGYDVPTQPFTTHTLFNGRSLTAYAREHFHAIPATDAARDNGRLQPGDILLFKDKRSAGQHVGIFKGYDAQGDIQFIGSQVSTGPAQAEARQGSYWNGGRFEIVGALRAKPEFQVGAPVHASAQQPVTAGLAATQSNEQRRAEPRPGVPTGGADADGVLQLGEKGTAVATLQRRLADLGYRGKDGRELGVDGEFGDNTKAALQAFQREHGLQGRGVAGPRTEAALDRAERSLVSHASHPHHPLYSQVLEKLHAEERAKGTRSGHHSERIAAALAVECLREGITRVDRVELNRDATLVRAVQVSPMRDEPGLNRSTDGISPAQAARQPMLESSEQIHQVAINRQAQAQDARQQLQQQQPPPAARAVPAM